MMPFAAAWRDLEASRLRKSSQTDKESTVWYHLYVEAKKIQQTDDYSKKKRSTLRDIESSLFLNVYQSEDNKLV